LHYYLLVKQILYCDNIIIIIIIIIIINTTTTTTTTTTTITITTVVFVANKKWILGVNCTESMCNDSSIAKSTPAAQSRRLKQPRYGLWY